MNHTLNVDVTEQTYEAILAKASADGATPAQIARAALEQLFQNGDGARTKAEPRDNDERSEARKRFERHFGELNLGAGTGADNVQIDAELAQEYADNHEER